MNEKVTLEEAAAICECSLDTLYTHLRNGHLPGTKPGQAWIILREAFFRRLNEIALAEAADRREAARPKWNGERMPQVDPHGRRRNPLASV